MLLRHITPLFLFLGATLFAQQAAISWGPVLDCNAQGAGSLRPRVALSGAGAPVVLWGDMSPMANYVAVGSGTAFGNPVEVSQGFAPAVADWMGSSIAAVGNTVWVVMKATPEESRPVYVRRSDDGGFTWGDTLRVDPSDGLVSRFPSIDLVEPNAPLVQYMQFDSGYFGARQVVCHMMGGAFMQPVQISSPFAPGDVCDCCPNQIIAGQDHTVALYRNAGPDIRVMWGAVSTDGGMSFPAGSVIDGTAWSLNACPSSGPDGYLATDSIRYVWMSGATNGTKVYIGNALASDLSLGDQNLVHADQPQGLQQNFPRIAGSGDTLGVVWQQISGGQSEILFSWSVTGPRGLSVPDTVNADLSGSQRTPDIAYANGAFHIVWSEVTGSLVRYRKAMVLGPNGTPEQGEVAPVRAWPNPVRDVLNLEGAQWTVAEVIDLQGKLVARRRLNAGTIDLSELAPGTYSVLLSDRQGAKGALRIEKQ